MKAVILAGGFGTRMGNFCETSPKPLTLVCGKPVLQHQIEALKKEGVTQFVFVLHHFADKIMNYFGDGASFGIEISYFCEKEPLGTAGALTHLDLKEDFLLLNGDLIFDFCLEDMVRFHKENHALATLFTHPNNHPYDSTLIKTDGQNRVVDLVSPEDFNGDNQNLCNAGIQIISPELLSMCKIKGKANFDKDVIKPTLLSNRIYSYKSAEYVHDMGTPERLARVESDINSGLVRNRNKKALQKAVFLDRDGTLNVYKGFITSPEQIELIDGVAEAVKAFNKLGFLAIIITNQPVIARGECTAEALNKIHNRIEMLLGEKGAYIDGIYYCPHHPHKGYEGEIAELKIQCKCRKPAAGMIFKAKDDFNIDLAKSYMVGDCEIDVECAENAGCKPIFLSPEKHKNALTFNSLYKFSEYLKKGL